MDKLRLVVWRPHTTVILIIGLVLILIGLVVSFMATHFKPTTEVRAGSGIYSLWVAKTESERIQGLSGVGGLLMDFEKSGYYSIWMKDMNFPLDIIWLNSKKQVVYIVMNAPPESPASTIYTSNDPARYVLELPAGSAKKAGIKTGTVVEFNLDV